MIPKRIAIVEDDDSQATALEALLRAFAQTHHDSFIITVFPNAMRLLDGYTAQWDLICMDIQLPFLDGMDAARRLRREDEDVPLVFVTSLANKAVEGYEVNALAYFVKPINPTDFTLKFTRIWELLRRREHASLLVESRSETIRVPLRDIQYVESLNHVVKFHTTRGLLTQYRSLKEVESELPERDFARCNSCYLVNLAHVHEIRDHQARVGDDWLQISRTRVRPFRAAVHDYWKQ